MSSEGDEAKASNKKQRIPSGMVELQFAGELILPKCHDRSYAGLFRRYEAIFETYANMERSQRLLNYRFFCGMLLTSHAKKTADRDLKKELFDKKNDIFFAIAKDPNLRRSVGFRYLVSKNFRVLKYCGDCEKSNTEQNLEARAWKHCGKCKVDRNFYNVLSMQHLFNTGSACLFLSNELIDRLKELKKPRKAKLDDFKEEIRFDKYHYTVRNLDAISLNSAAKMFEKVMGQ